MYMYRYMYVDLDLRVPVLVHISKRSKTTDDEKMREDKANFGGCQNGRVAGLLVRFNDPSCYY
jgi:hypothetical protein